MEQPSHTWRRALVTGACAVVLGLAGAPAAGAAPVNTPDPGADSTASPGGAAPAVPTPPSVDASTAPVEFTVVGVSALVLGIGGFAFGLARRARSSARR
jgi:hypothetical protein